MKTASRAACALTIAAAAATLPTSAIAAPVTVTLRIEGPSATLYEGPVTTDVRQFAFSAPTTGTPGTCDGTSANGGTSLTPVPTSGAALAAAIAGGLQVTGTWNPAFGATPKVISGIDLAYDAGTGRYLAEYYNGTAASLGSCATPIRDGDEVLFAYGTGSEPALKLTVPATAAPGQTVTATVKDGTGAPVGGALVDGRTTAADGTVAVGPFSAAGPRSFKATKTGTIRSNTGQLCITTGSDGACGTTVPTAAPTPGVSLPAAYDPTCLTIGQDGRCGTKDTTAPLVDFQGIWSRTYTKRSLPEEIKGVAGNFRNGRRLDDPSDIADVRLRLTRYKGDRCYYLDGDSESFKKLDSCEKGAGEFFSAGKGERWSYKLPGTLKTGKYRLEGYAVDGAGNSDTFRRWNVNHIVFRVER